MIRAESELSSSFLVDAERHTLNSFDSVRPEGQLLVVILISGYYGGTSVHTPQTALQHYS